jgi:biopolymer transport protein ExbD
MKKYLMPLITGCLGLCVGSTLCYIYLVPHPATEAASSPPQARGEQIVVTIAADGTMCLAGERLDLSRLETRLKELAPQRRPIAIRADKDAQFKQIVAVMDASKAAAEMPK